MSLIPDMLYVVITGIILIICIWVQEVQMLSKSFILCNSPDFRKNNMTVCMIGNEPSFEVYKGITIVESLLDN